MRGVTRIGVLIRQLEARYDDQVVQQTGSRGLSLDRLEVFVEVPRVYVVRRRALRQPGVTAAHAVVGDTEDVEAARAVEIDGLPQAEIPVAEGRVAVELAEQLITRSSASPSAWLAIPLVLTDMW